MAEELQVLINTCTWDLVDLPPDKSVVRCKWVYKIKTHADGSIDRYKARLVTKGFTQDYGIDYEETFALVARPTSVRSLIAIVAAKHWKIFQMDVKKPFSMGIYWKQCICNLLLPMILHQKILSPKKGFLWPQASTSSMVFQVQFYHSSI